MFFSVFFLSVVSRDPGIQRMQLWALHFSRCYCKAAYSATYFQCYITEVVSENGLLYTTTQIAIYPLHLQESELWSHLEVGLHQEERISSLGDKKNTEFLCLTDVARDKAIGNGHQTGENFSETRKHFPWKSIKNVCFLSTNAFPVSLPAFILQFRVWF